MEFLFDLNSDILTYIIDILNFILPLLCIYNSCIVLFYISTIEKPINFIKKNKYMFMHLHYL